MMDYHIGQKVSGHITGIKPYGAFVVLDDHVQGLIHISECKTGVVRALKNELKIGQKVVVTVLDIEQYNNKISLSLRQDDIMLKQPRKIKEPILNKGKIVSCLVQGFYIFITTFINYCFLIKNGIDHNKAITITYAMLVLSIILAAFQLKSSNITIKEIIKSLKDKFTIFVNTAIIIGLIIMIYVPFFNKIANTTPIDLKWWLYIIVAAFITVIPFDISKKINQG